MFLKSVRFLSVILLCSGIQHLAANDKKCVLFGIQNVLIYPDMHKVSGGSLGGMLGFTPEKVEQELLDTLAPITVNNFPIWTGTYPAIIEAWLTGYLHTDTVHNDAAHYVKKHCGLMKRARLGTTIDYAFTKKQAGTFSSLSDTVNLARSCKKDGCIIGLCSNWNKELFPTLKVVQNSSLGFFDREYISGFMGKIAATSAFYDAVINEFGADNIVLIDVLPENIRVAKKRGIKTIYFTSAAATRNELKKIGFLA